MRKVVLYQLMSLDGVAEEPGNWMFDGGTAIFRNLAQVIATQDTVLLGRGTYDYWVDYWPSADLEPFAGFINGTDKHVFTSTSVLQAWSNTTVVTAAAVEHVTNLKRQPGGDIGIHGSIMLARSLWQGGLIDEVRLVVASTVAKGGRRLFDGPGDLRRLHLLDLDRTSAGTLLIGYRVNTPASGLVT